MRPNASTALLHTESSVPPTVFIISGPAHWPFHQFDPTPKPQAHELLPPQLAMPGKCLVASD